jgi:hypothetical protein
MASDSDISIEIIEDTPVELSIVEDTPINIELVATGPAGSSGVQSVVAGTNVTVNNTDPQNPIVSATGGGGGGGIAVGDPVTGGDPLRFLTTDASGDLSDDGFGLVPISLFGGAISGFAVRATNMPDPSLSFGMFDATGVGGGLTAGAFSQKDLGGSFGMVGLDSANDTYANPYYQVTIDSSNEAVMSFSGLGLGAGGSLDLASSKDGIRVANGVIVNDFSDDVTLAGDSSVALVTEHAVKTYVDAADTDLQDQIDAIDVGSVALTDFVDSASIDFFNAYDTGDPQTIGSTADGGNILSSFSSRVRLWQVDSGAEEGKLQTLKLRSWLDTGNQNLKAFIYADSSNTAGALLATSATLNIANTTEAVNTFTFSGAEQIIIAPNTKYWLGYANEQSGNQLSISTTSGGNNYTKSGITFASQPENPADWAGLGSAGDTPDGYIEIAPPKISAEGIGTASKIASFNASGLLRALDTTTYPSLTELAYVKGVTSAIQTQITAKLDSSAYDDATTAETNTGTSTTKYVSPDGLAGSYAGTKVASVYVIEAGTAVTTGDGKAYLRINSDLNGMDLVSASIAVITTSSSGLPTVQLARGRQSSATSAHSFVDMLSTKVTIDATEYDSKDATTPAVIDTANDDVATGDLIRIDVDVAGTGTAGLILTMAFRLP